MANTEYKQIPHVQWHTPHFCPLLDVTNTRGGRAKGRTLSDLVTQNFSNCSVQCGITQGFPCSGSGTPDVQQNSFLGNLDGERGKNSPIHILTGTQHQCVFQEWFTTLVFSLTITVLHYNHTTGEDFVRCGKRSVSCQELSDRKTSSSPDLFHHLFNMRKHCWHIPLMSCSPVQTARWFVLGCFSLQ